MMLRQGRIALWASALGLLMASPYAAAQQAPEPAIHFIWMGGSDCDPCVKWRGLELPKLQETAEFRKVRFSYVTKTIQSPIPSSMFLPDEVKPYKEALDRSSGGRAGSPQWAVLVNGQVVDHQWGARSAEDFRQIFAAIQTEGTYPTNRCAVREAGKCTQRGRAGAKLPRAVLTPGAQPAS